MRKYINSTHHWTVLGPTELVELLDAATTARDLPGMGDVDASLMAFCSRISKRVPAALSAAWLLSCSPEPRSCHP